MALRKHQHLKDGQRHASTSEKEKWSGGRQWTEKVQRDGERNSELKAT